MGTAQLPNLVRFMEGILAPGQYSSADISRNGLQVESCEQAVTTVGLAVDAAQSIFEMAILKKCQLIVAHHGLFWGNSAPLLAGNTGKKIRTLIEGRCSLYVSHLPLDGNMQVGNAAELGRRLELSELSAAFEVEQGVTVGAVGNLPAPIPQNEIEEFILSKIISHNDRGMTRSLLFGSAQIQRVGIATGSASSLITSAKRLGCDLFITGEPKQEAYHMAKEVGINVIFAGHYHTETFGVRAMGRLLEKEFGISTVFLDEPTGI
ncbi:MAG: Nif3-like dinuclear metal center hexameric protein [Bdellovibrionales bacterium]|nr:Nif3-like dinuclear metal center hexameric protein [Bdellovibrionales bacterium]